MSLAPGTRFGQYEVVAYLDAGGMGEVYRARDTVLGRDVALKIPPQAVWADPHRAARLEREARLLAALNHPNIATIHGLEQLTTATTSTQTPVRGIVLELVEGQALTDLLARRTPSIDETIAIATQLVDALEAAHEIGIVHRDLKPANVKLRPDGTLKVLDFGIAKALDTAAAPAQSSPMLTAERDGATLGTAAYMSPEQARGEPVDERTDIWAFGCIVFETLTGISPFAGSTTTASLAAVLERAVDWSKLPASTPPGVRRLLRRCLEKDRRRRLADIRDARFELENVESDEVRSARRPAPTLWLLVAAATFAILALVAGLALLDRPSSDALETRLEIATLPTNDPWSFAISPDGRKVVFAGIAEGSSQLWLRRFESDQGQPLPGTDDATLPFWSPDGRSIGFFAGGELKRLEIEGGVIQSLASAVSGDGGVWGNDGVILFSPHRNRGVLSIPASGGTTTSLTEVLAPQQQNHASPELLPDGRHFLYYVQSGPDARGVYLKEIGGTGARRLLDADAGAAFLSTGYLLFVRQATLYAQKFDTSQLELVGAPVAVAEGVLTDAGLGQGALSVSATGVIAYRRGTAAGSQLVWFNRSGNRLGNLGDRRNPPLRTPSISPDGRQVAFYASVNGNTDVWLLDANRGVPSRFTFDSSFDNSPIWSPDGATLVFASNRSGRFDLYRRGVSAVAGSEELLLASPNNKIPTDWSSDGRFLLYRTTLEQNFDIMALDLTGDQRVIEIATSNFDEREAQFSPDMRWIAYQSNESGRFEVYVQPFPGPGGKTLVSDGGGAQARWRSDGRELFYLSLDNRLMAVPIELGADGRSVQVGAPAPLFTANPMPVGTVDIAQYVVSADGQQFLVNSIADSTASSITVLMNWQPPR